MEFSLHGPFSLWSPKFPISVNLIVFSVDHEDLLHPTDLALQLGGSSPMDSREFGTLPPALFQCFAQPQLLVRLALEVQADIHPLIISVSQSHLPIPGSVY